MLRLYVQKSEILSTLKLIKSGLHSRGKNARTIICEDIKRSAISAKTKITTDLVGKHVTRFRPHLNEEELQKYF